MKKCLYFLAIHQENLYLQKRILLSEKATRQTGFDYSRSRRNKMQYVKKSNRRDTQQQETTYPKYRS